MRKIFFILLIAAPVFIHAQMAVGIYPTGSMMSLSWNPETVLRDSSNTPHFVTNHRVKIELRTPLNVRHNSRGTRITAAPELGFFTRISGEEGEPMLLTGVGLATTINHGGLTSGGIFFPLVFEYQPMYHHLDHLLLDLEGDALVDITSSRQTLMFRPLFSVKWMFN